MFSTNSSICHLTPWKFPFQTEPVYTSDIFTYGISTSGNFTSDNFTYDIFTSGISTYIDFQNVLLNSQWHCLQQKIWKNMVKMTVCYHVVGVSISHQKINEIQNQVECK